jgi:hypothetical protein
LTHNINFPIIFFIRKKQVLSVDPVDCSCILENRALDNDAASGMEQVFGGGQIFFLCRGKSILPSISMTPDDFVTHWNYPQGAFVRGKPAGAHLDVSRPLPKLTNYRT